ncbi:unnamed protein product, partial [Oppiella nova]
MICQKWWQRLQGCQRAVEDWQKILQVHSLVLQPHEDMRSYLKFAKLCQRSGRLQLSYRTLVSLMDTDPSNLVTGVPLPTTYPMVTFRYIEHLWISGQKEEAFNQLAHFTQVALIPQNIHFLTTDESQQIHQRNELNKLLS